MRIFKRQKEDVAEITIEETVMAEKPIINKEYPKIVQEIHSSFYSAAEKLVEEAEEYKEQAESREVKKGLSLSDMGFKQANQVKEAIEIDENYSLSTEQVKCLNKYKMRYPLCKFITEKQVEAVCKKYGLIMGEVGLYTGFVPEKNMKEILSFKGLRDEDGYDCEILSNQNQVVGYVKFDDIIDSHWKKTVIEGGDAYVQFSRTKEVNVIGGNKKWGEYSKVKKCQDNGMLICAPVKDMDMTGMTIEEGYKIVNIPELIDPVVLKRVVGGYLILTAWGDEASDPLVVNEINN